MDKLDLNQKIKVISDDFGSTFTFVSETEIANLLTLEDLPGVEVILKKHLGDVVINFSKTFHIPPNSAERDIWIIKIS
jgi:hypothetical protein